MSIRYYVGIFAVLVASAVTAYIFPAASFVREFLALPAVAALFAALFTLVRDESRFQKERILEREKQHFSLAISSHMASVAFDKHVAFCEKYLETMRRGLTTLSSKGPCSEAMDLAAELKDVRLDFAAWITREIRQSLAPFERALLLIGAHKHFVKDLPIGTEREKTLKEAYDLFAKVMETESNDKEVGVSKVVEKLQDILGISELTYIRKSVIKEASKALLPMPVLVTPAAHAPVEPDTGVA